MWCLQLDERGAEVVGIVNKEYRPSLVNRMKGGWAESEADRPAKKLATVHILSQLGWEQGIRKLLRGSQCGTFSPRIVCWHTREEFRVPRLTHHKRTIARLSTEYILRHPDLYLLLRTAVFPGSQLGKRLINKPFCLFTEVARRLQGCADSGDAEWAGMLTWRSLRGKETTLLFPLSQK